MFGFNFNRNRETYIDYSKKPESIKMIEYIESQLNSDQLKKLELSGRGETFSFKDRMIVAYGHMYPTFSDQTFKPEVEEIIDRYKHLFDKGLEFEMNEPFIKKFEYLFAFYK